MKTEVNFFRKGKVSERNSFIEDYASKKGETTGERKVRKKKKKDKKRTKSESEKRRKK